VAVQTNGFGFSFETSRNLSVAAISVVVQLRLWSWVIVVQRPFFSGKPGWVRSRAWIWLFSYTLGLGSRDSQLRSNRRVGAALAGRLNDPAAEGDLLCGTVSGQPLLDLAMLLGGNGQGGFGTRQSSAV
jgi:hypothetical protein